MKSTSKKSVDFNEPHDVQVSLMDNTNDNTDSENENDKAATSVV